jgi:hypothetical protein
MAVSPPRLEHSILVTTGRLSMLDIVRIEDVRNVILAANAVEGEVSRRAFSEAGTLSDALADRQAYQAGYEAALATVAVAFGIPLSPSGRLRATGVAVPGGRLAVSYRAEQSLRRLMIEREEFAP